MSKWKERYPYANSIYNALPYVYVVSGVLVMLVLRNQMSVLSGTILILAGAIVMTLRYRYRRLLAFDQAPPSRVQARQPGPVRPALDRMQMSWLSAYECGHPVIDAQHRRLFGISNELIQAAMSGQSKNEMALRVDELIAHTSDHFGSEEAILARTRYPLSAEHQTHHQALLTQARALRDQYLHGLVGEGVLIGFLVDDLITNHILKEDLKFAVTLG